MHRADQAVGTIQALHEHNLEASATQSTEIGTVSESVTATLLVSTRGAASGNGDNRHHGRSLEFEDSKIRLFTGTLLHGPEAFWATGPINLGDASSTALMPSHWCCPTASGRGYICCE